MTTTDQYDRRNFKAFQDTDEELHAGTTICIKCGITPIYFDKNKRNDKGVFIPLEVATKQLHECDISKPFR